jgi:hypothetical protein
LQYWVGQSFYDGLFEPPGGTFNNVGGSPITVFSLVQNRYTFGDDVLWTKGAHSLRFGASFAYSQANTINNLKESPLWVVNSPPFGQPPLSNFVSGGVFADVEGVIPGTSPLYGPTYGNRDYRQSDFDPYVQDDWKVSQKLTINLGLRWELYTNPSVARGVYEIANIATSTAFTQYNNVFASNPSYKDFDPRIGIAYDPFSDHKTSVRAGFGMFHDPIVGLDYQIGLQTNPPWLDYVLYNAPGYPTPFATGTVGTLPTATQGWNRSTDSTPYVEQYNLNIQRELVQNTVLTVAYVGSHGVHLFTGIDGNPPIPTVNSAGQLQFGGSVNGAYVANPRINPNFGGYTFNETIASSHYNSLQVMVNRRFSQNFQAQINYTYSKCMDNGALGIGSLNGPGGGSGAPSSAQNPYNNTPDWAVCSYDLTNVLRANGLYALPFHANRLVSGWQISTILSDYSGVPFTIGTGFSNTVDPSGDSPRANWVYGCNPTGITQDRLEWFNPACFTTPAAGLLGNLGRNTLRGPGFFDWDVALLKDTKLTERTNLQFRAEFFNILNHENFANPNPVPASQSAPTAGQITSSNGGTTPRQIQFALKLRF